MQGFLRRKSRAEAQQEKPFQQTRFDGGQNSDTIATKIAINEFALSKNTVHTQGDVQGHWGRKLFSQSAAPGSGRLHQVTQHPKTGKWLVHRGNKLWLSVDRAADAWVEVMNIGPDGSLSATGSFIDGRVTLSGDITTYLSNMVLTGVTGGEDLVVSMTDTAGPTVTVTVSNTNGDELCAGTMSVPPAGTYALVESGGSGVSGLVNVDGYTSPVPVGSGVVNNYIVDFTLRGLTLENTDDYQLWWNVAITGATATLTLYKDSTMTDSVAEAADFNPGSAPQLDFSPLNNSGISGTSTWPIDSYIDGTYIGSELTFTFESVSIDADSTISPYSETGFIVFVRGATPHNIYVQQTLNLYWFISTASGYGPAITAFGMPDVYDYRYLYTFSRIVNGSTLEPDYSANRNSAVLQFEGPSNTNNGSGVDYLEIGTADPISGSHPFDIPLANGSSVPIGMFAAAYITHISIYRTLDVGVNGIGIDGAANNSEVYIWIEDVPIYSVTYSDSTDDTTLRNRLVGASTEQDSLSLRSRLFREMARGIGAIGPDYMVTAFPQAQQASYCDIAVNPRLIGFNFPGTQRFIVQDPISEIYRTKELFVILCPSSTYTSVSAINSETGIPGLIPISTIQNFTQASKTLGIKYGQGVFAVDESSFITLLSDGTVRVFSASSWGEPLEGTKLHNMTSLAQVGAVFSFLRGVMLMWYRSHSGPDLAGPGSAVLSDLVLTGGAYDMLYGQVVFLEAGDAYEVALYSDTEMTNKVASGSVIGLATQPQTVTITAIGDSGVNGSVYCDLTGYELPLNFTVDFREITDTCIRLGTGGNAGSGWSVLDRPYWAYPGTWCGTLIVEDDASLLRMVAVDRADNAIFAIEDALPLRQFTDDVVTSYAGTLTGDAAAFLSNLVVYGLVPGTEYQVIITGVSPADVTVAIYKDVTPLAQFDGLIANQPLTGAVLAEVGGSGVSGTFDLAGYTGGYVMGTLHGSGVAITSQADISSTIFIRELTGSQENFTCFHQESHVAVRPRYGQAALPAGLLFTVKGYEAGVLNPGAVTTAMPLDFDIQFFARLRGKQIQVSYESNKSGWRITSFDTLYQSQDMQSYGGPWNSVEGDVQAALASGLVSEIYGSTGIIDRASPVNASYVGAQPLEMTGPSATFFGQRFLTPVTRELDVTLQDYTLMAWVQGSTPGSTPVQAAGDLMLSFTSATHLETGIFGVDLSPSVAFGNGWQHFAVTRLNGVVTVYQNGLPIGSTSPFIAEVAVGTMTVGSPDASEDIDHMRLYNKALTAEEILYYYTDVATNGGLRVLP